MIKRKCRHQFNVTQVRYDYSRVGKENRWVDNKWHKVRNDFYTVYAICQKCEGEEKATTFIRRTDGKDVIMEIGGWEMRWNYRKGLGYDIRAEHR